MTRPQADYISIPSSVDPDADPLAPCSQCKRYSRRAYSKGLCVECVETDISRLACGFPECDTNATARLPDGKPCCKSCGELILNALKEEQRV